MIRCQNFLRKGLLIFPEMIFDSLTRRELLACLREMGVFDLKGRNTLISDALHCVANEELSWPYDNSQRSRDTPVSISTSENVLSVPEHFSVISNAKANDSVINFPPD